MCARKMSSREQELVSIAHRVLPGGSLGNIGNDLVIDRGKGSHIWDVGGNEYIDYLLGSGPMLVGHSHPEVLEVVREQIEKGTTFFLANEHAILLAEEIVRAVPCAEKVRFSSTGSEATLYAMRAARAYRGRDKILKFEGGFHGMNDYALMSMAPANPAPFPQAVPDSAGIPKAIQAEMLIAPFNDLETTTAIIDRHHDEIGGVIVEPFQRLIPPQPGFLQGLREITEHYQIPLIFDEVVTGFRFGYGGAQEYYGVTPDICSLGKAVAGGFPLTAIAGREEIMAHMDSGSVDSDAFMPQIGTLSGNPIAAAAGLKTLEILRREGTYEKIFATGNRIKEALQRLLDEAEIPAKVIGESSLFDVFFTETEVTDYRSTLEADSNLMAKFNSSLFEQGIFKGASKFYISAAHTEEDVEKTIAAFATVVDQLRG
jgi:glutamate-1-semialdehyde 2,1-aminomutase